MNIIEDKILNMIKPKKNYFTILFWILFLLLGTPVIAKDLKLINGKKFIVLTDEAPPKNMKWNQYGKVLESFHGVKAISNGSKNTNRKYQCTELIHRFLREIYGLPSYIELGLGNGKDLAYGISKKFAKPTRSIGLFSKYLVHLEYFESGKSKYPPVVGSIVSMHFNKDLNGYGHVGIIRTLVKNDDGSLTGFLFDQHGSMYKTVGVPIYADKVIFNKRENGHWIGTVYSQKFKRKYPIIGWASVIASY